MRRLLIALAVILALAHPAHAGFQDLLDAARANDTALAARLLAEGTEPNGGPSGFPDSYSPLQWAARHGNTTLIGLLLKAGADTERRDFNGDRPLQWAASAGQAEAIRLLVAAGSPVASPADTYGSPLILAARAASADALRALIDGGAWLDFPEQGGAALREAALTQDPDTVRVLLEAGADPNIADDILSETPLHIAAARQEVEVVRLLLEAGADPAPLDGDGRAALHIAAFRGLPDNVAALLAAGADPRQRDAEDRLPLVAAIEGKPFEWRDNDAAALLLVPHTDDLTATFLAAADAGLPHTARALLARGADPNAVAANGTSALAMVARLDGIPGEALLEAMFKFGVDLSRFGIDGLVSAAASNQVAIAERLLQYGLPVDGDAGRSPVLAAAEAGALEALEFLLARGAVPVDPALIEIVEFTPLELLQLEEAQYKAGIDLRDEALRERVETLRARQLAARAILAAAIAAP